MLLCTKDPNNYIGHTGDLRPRSNNSKSMVRNNDGTLYLYPTHFNQCADGKEPYFFIYPFYFVDDAKQREFTESRFIKRFKPTLNGKR